MRHGFYLTNGMKRIITPRFLTGTFLVALLNGPALAETSIANPKLEQQRLEFIQAESLAGQPNSERFKKLVDKLGDYPLVPYLKQKSLIAYPYLANRELIEQFLVDYANTPLDRPLREKWLTYLASKNQQQLFLSSYRDTGENELDCKRAEFMLADPAQKEQALEIIEQLWVVGESQPKECDKIFKEWQSLGLRTPDLVWKRLTLAAEGGSHTLVPYLKTLLPTEQRYLADLWLKVRRSPTEVSRISNFPGKFPQYETQIMTYGLTRLVWNNRDLALSSWQKLETSFTFSPEQLQAITTKFAISLALINHEDAEEWLERASALIEDEELARWHLAHILRDQDWQHAIDVIEFAPNLLAKDYLFQYWRARAFDEVGAPEQAKEAYEMLASQRHYYGFMASGKLARHTSLNNTPLVFTQQELDSVANIPAIQRAFEFRAISRNISARREWYSLQSQLTEKQLNIAAVLADQQGWHDQAIFTFAKSGYLDDLSRRFPMAFDQTLKSNAQKYDIDPAWAFAIVRRESSFMSDANSGAGAKGLMQLMPSTARYLAKQTVSTSSLFNPLVNVQLGTQYMRYLMDKMDNNPILVTASYNAGWRRVRNWLPEKNSMPMDLWVETIPYKETRNYVKAVLAYQQIYTEQLGNDENIFKKLATMKIKPKS